MIIKKLSMHPIKTDAKKYQQAMQVLIYTCSLFVNNSTIH
ncbi:hypothetical protein BRYFOR_05421 [Marvinbryantia formatexigens DSM 14469]|uniref:Uncharacterized protein n=1 Tax=Marvinbryantia formatexigens DSM 14469 TaxID=478749 RepID=C6L9X9_9FIRM|nr:hypothetical protein BRYFOR_05421 [Marvinbryantia formatexigens DSM 14469]